MAVEEGKRAPAFTLKDADGNKVALKDFFTLLCDPDRKVMEKYGAYGEKMMYGKKTIGIIRSTTWIGPTGKVIKHWKRVASAEKHPAQILALIQNSAEA